MANKIFEPKVVHISAEEGQPSTFWKGENGKYYLTKQSAITSTGTCYSDISKFEKNKSFLSKYKKYILSGLCAAAVVAAMFYFIPKYVKH